MYLKLHLNFAYYTLNNNHIPLKSCTILIPSGNYIPPVKDELEGTEPNGFLLGSLVGLPPSPNPPNAMPAMKDTLKKKMN